VIGGPVKLQRLFTGCAKNKVGVVGVDVGVGVAVGQGVV